MKSKDNMNLGFGTAIALVAVGGVATYVAMNSAAEKDARVAEYTAAFGGRVADIGPARGFAIPLILIVVTLLVGLALWWRSSAKSVDSHNAKVPNEPLLDELFKPGKEVVSFQIGKGTMSHAVVVVGAKSRGYDLASQGEDGSLVFEPIGINAA